VKQLHYILLVTLLFFAQAIKGQQNIQSGLYFASHEVIQDQRTSLNLTPDKPFKFTTGFSLEFDINFRQDDGWYGYICRIIGNDNTNIDLVSNMASSYSNFWLIYKDEVLLNYKWEDLPSFDYDQWVNIRIDFDILNSRLTLTMNEKKREMDAAGLENLRDFFISFGACKYKRFYSTDVCPMTVRNIRLYKPENQLFRQWILGKHAINKVYDEVSEAEAVAENPQWLIDRYLKWRQIKDIHIDNLLGVASDIDNKRLFFINDKAVYPFSLESLKMDTIEVETGAPYNDQLEQNVIYNKYTNEIWFYNFTDPISRFNFKTKEWSENLPESVTGEYGHHNRLISPLDGSLVTLLGYGYYQYKSTVNVYDPKTTDWQRIERNNEITPRYLSGTGQLNDSEWLVFGGYGNKSGRQELSPTHYYDLYTFNIKDYSFHKKWELPTPSYSFVPSETLVVKPETDTFYSLVYDNGYYDSFLQLAEFSINEPRITLLGDSIPFRYKDTESWVYLLLDEHKSELIAIAQHKDDISLYILAFPPLTPEDTMQRTPLVSKILKWVAIGTGAVLLLIVFIFVIRKFKFRRNESFVVQPLPAVERKKVSSIYLLGEFGVFGKNGDDLTSNFSPTLKQLFLFILFNTIYQRGVSSTTLDEVLWHDKIGDSARNNRNVNLSKLRSLLDEVGKIEVIYTNSLWSIRIPSEVYCDYLEIVDFISNVKKDNLSEKEIIRFISLVQTGTLLPQLPVEWIKTFIERYTKELTDALMILLNSALVKEDISLRFYTAECLLNMDPLNDEALSIVCSILQKTGKHSLAKITYDSFLKNFEKETGTAYPVSFQEVVK